MGVLKPRQTHALPASSRAFRRRLLEWFEREARDYPWRRTVDPYAVLVSEIMLQQTQIATVLGKGYYQRFVSIFPGVEELARADDESLLKAWEGLGYYRRARMLRETAKAVTAQHGGEFPSALDELMKLPGIGPYTAGALRAFAFGLPAVLVDGNVARVISRLMDFRDEVDSTPGSKQLWKWAAQLADDQNSRHYHAALMELGQRICRPRQPDCTSCPVAGFCATKDPETLPRKKARVKSTQVNEHAIWLRNKDGEILMHREQGSRRTGLWKLPLRDSSALAKSPVVAELNYAITRYKVHLLVHELSSSHSLAAPDSGEVWVAEEDVPTLAMAAPFRKVVERLLDE